MAAALDAAGLREWLQTATTLVERHRAELDALNVFPVADNDTGSNVLATLRGAVAGPDAGLAAARAARGNSGLILAELLRGIFAACADGMTGATLLSGLRGGVARAYEAVSAPVEGTALTVAAAAAAGPADPALTLAEVARGAAARADRALLATRDQLPELRRAGVVDAGGRAVCLLLDALVATVTGEPAGPMGLGCAPALRSTGAGSRYEVQYVVVTDTIDQLRSRLVGLGDSLVTADLGNGEWSVHVHVADAGAAVEAALSAGRPHGIRIEALPAVDSVRALIAVGLGEIAAVLRAEGVCVVADPGAIGDAAAGSSSVVLLVAGEAAAAHEAVATLRGNGTVAAVLPVRSPVQALAAVAVHDPDAEFSDAVVAMAEAAAATRCGEVRRSDKTAQTSAGPCKPGDVLGLADDEVVLIGADAPTVAAELLDRMLAGSGELVTLLGGPLAAAARTHLAQAYATVEVAVHECGGSDLLIGVE